jgi:hypothetical protein
MCLIALIASLKSCLVLVVNTHFIVFKAFTNLLFLKAPSFGATTQSSAGTLFGAGNTQSTTPAFGSNVTNSATAGTLFGGPASAAAAASTPGTFCYAEHQENTKTKLFSFYL